MKANEVKTYGQLEEFLNENAVGKEVGYSTWSGFYSLEQLMRDVDKKLCTRKIKYERSNAQRQYLYYGYDLCLGYIEFKKTANGTFKSVTLACVDKNKSWLDDVVSAEKRQSEAKEKALKALAEHGFESFEAFQHFISYELPEDMKKEVRRGY